MGMRVPKFGNLRHQFRVRGSSGSQGSSMLIRIGSPSHLIRPPPWILVLPHIVAQGEGGGVTLTEGFYWSASCRESFVGALTPLKTYRSGPGVGDLVGVIRVGEAHLGEWEQELGIGLVHASAVGCIY